MMISSSGTARVPADAGHWFLADTSARMTRRFLKALRAALIISPILFQAGERCPRSAVAAGHQLAVAELLYHAADTGARLA